MQYSTGVLDFNRLDSDSPMAAGQLAMRRSPSLPPDGVVRIVLHSVQADSRTFVNYSLVTSSLLDQMLDALLDYPIHALLQVHLIIRKSSAGVHWRHAPGAKLELSISADATAEDVAAELEAANDLPANQHLLMYNGKVQSAGWLYVPFP